jgi:hypothetical protein
MPMNESPRDALSSACDSAAALKWRLAVLADYYAQRDPSRAPEADVAFQQASEICERLDSLRHEHDDRGGV